MSTEKRNNMKTSGVGNKNAFYGKHHSAESKLKNREKHLKNNLSIETVEKMRKAKKGRSYNEIYGVEGAKIKKINISKTLKQFCKNLNEKKKRSKRTSGKNNGMYGIHRYGKDAPMYGKKQSKEKCIYCKKEYSKTNIIRWHNEMCKCKNLILEKKYE